MELGQSGIRLTDLKLLLDFYGVTGDHAEPLQLLHVAEVSRRKNVTVQAFPLNAATYVASSYNFIVLRFGEASGVIYVETFADADYLDSPEAVRAYTRLWARLQAAALGPVESRKLILRIVDEIK
ncbi:Scr1 family TA system antitoxin-like transcriptional regulator [Micromonospora sp. NPDC049101]|uniref:Scr1 family TA system antitoxin-like transcriptional regulator n=1 Tax=Micromonospora sp. NPDC049101 TaxID=3155032 RepID=UPI0033DAE8EB